MLEQSEGVAEDVAASSQDGVRCLVSLHLGVSFSEGVVPLNAARLEEA